MLQRGISRIWLTDVVTQIVCCEILLILHLLTLTCIFVQVDITAEVESYPHWKPLAQLV